jgi:hypothetical protein
MKIKSPILNINEEATEDLVNKVIRALKSEKVGPFAILSSGELTYVQTVWTENGFVLEFQEGSTDRHYVVMHYLSVPKVQDIFCRFLNGDDSWKGSYPIKKKKVVSLFYKASYALGNFLGNLVRGFNEARKK